ALLAGMGQRAAARMAASSDGEALDDAHVGAATVQGILADFQEQTRYFENDFCRAAGVGARDEDGLFRSWDHFDGGNYRAIDGTDARRPCERIHFHAAR